jgi:hypothetical protein
MMKWSRLAFVEEGLIEEARKYKTKEEFIETQDTSPEEFYLKVSIRDKECEIIKNPSGSDFEYLIVKFNETYPRSGLEDTAKTRVTYDQYGNEYIWQSHLADHREVEEYLKEVHGLKADQNRNAEKETKKRLTANWEKAQE